MAKRRPHPDSESAGIIHGGAAMFQKLRRLMNKKLAAELIEMIADRELTYRDLTRLSASDESFGALHVIATQWARKSPQFFGEQVHLAAREVLENWP